MKRTNKRKPLRASTETYEVQHSQDPQVHQDALSAPAESAAAPAGASQVMVSTNPVELEDESDRALSEPLKYVVSAPEAIDKAEVLLKKVREARPDLATEVDSLLSGVENLENKALGIEEHADAPAPAPSQPGEALPVNTATAATEPVAGGVNPGDRVVAQTKDGEFAGVVEDVNEDGTLEVLTDTNMKLSHVPADSVKKEAEGETASMALPAGIQSSRRQRVKKNIKAKASPAKAMGAGKNSGEGVASAPAGAPLSPQEEMAVKAARAAFMAGTLDLNLMGAYLPAAQEEVKRLLADKTLKLAASAFDKLESLDIGGGMTAKRSEGKDEVKTVAVLDKDGKEVARYPDAFGDDTITIIKLFRQLHDIKEADDKAAATGEKSESSDESKKPKALPKTEKKDEKKDEKDKELAAAEKNFTERLSMVREIVSARVSKRYVVAQQDDIDANLLKGMTLEASMNEALKTSVDREVMRLLALPDTELPVIQASLGSLKPRPIQVETTVSNEGLPMVAGLQLYAEKAEEEGLGLQAAFGSSYRR